MSKTHDIIASLVGSISATIRSTAPTRWLICDGSTIGSASSGATYANAKYEALYRVLYDAVSNTILPVVGGRGANASADWTANKPITLPDLRGRALVSAGTGTISESVSAVTAATNAIAVATNTDKWVTGMPVTVSGLTGFASLTNGAYFLIRVDSTHVKFASTLAAAQVGTAATLTGTGSLTFTSTLAVRAVGDKGGEEAHAMSSVELLVHSHNIPVNTNDAGGLVGRGNGGAINNVSVDAYGGNNAMNNMQPYFALNYMIHY